MKLYNELKIVGEFRKLSRNLFSVKTAIACDPIRVYTMICCGINRELTFVAEPAYDDSAVEG